MNFRMIAKYLGLVLRFQAVFLVIPMLFSLFRGEYTVARAFAATLGICVLGFLLLGLCKCGDNSTLFIKDSFVAVAVCWIAISIVGAFPFWFSGEIPGFMNAVFESTSGFTTTGASILPNVEVLSSGLLLWRSLAHWVGGMGVLVFLLAIVPAISGGERSVNVMKAESPGPSPGKLVPKLRQSSMILYAIYFGLTILEFVLLLLGGMPVFDSVVNAMATAGTGGFAIKAASIGAYGSVYLEMVIAVFMMLFAINFNIFYFIIVRNFGAVFKNDELRVYLGIVGASTLCIALNLFRSVYQAFPDALRYAFFQVTSIISSTGFATADFNLWPTFSKVVLFVLMFIGASAGSTGGGIKVARVIILFREARRALYNMVHPRSVKIVKLDGKPVERNVAHSVNAYLATFMLIFFVSILIVALDNFSFETTLSAVIACLNNIGPGFGTAGPAGSFADFSLLSKIVLTINMLLGRLELYPILLLFSARTYQRI